MSHDFQRQLRRFCLFYQSQRLDHDLLLLKLLRLRFIKVVSDPGFVGEQASEEPLLLKRSFAPLKTSL
jgi:hypothetical protein